jgi:glutamyl-tRNA synthetase
MATEIVRTRIAPSPTGYPHIGTIYQALFNYAYAHQHNGKFLVRIEDTDRSRFVEGAYVPEVTSQKPNSVADMPENGDWIVRMRVPQRDITFRDEIRGDITFAHDQVTEQVLLKSDKFPTYHLAVVVDDHLMGITHVVRGEEWISSTPKHVLLYEYFGWEKPKFYHTPDLRNPDKSKLSKRHGHTDVRWYQSEGYLHEAILNFLALQGWSHPEEKEIFSLDEFIHLFDLKDLKPVGPIFDLVKLGWMNGMYIREGISEEELKKRLLSFDSSLREIDNDLFYALVPVVRTRIKTLREFGEQVKPFLEPTKHEASPEVAKIVSQIKDDVMALKSWNADSIKQVIIDKYILEKKIKLKDLYQALIGTERGLPLADTFAAIGRERTLRLFDTV